MRAGAGRRAGEAGRPADPRSCPGLGLPPCRPRAGAQRGPGDAWTSAPWPHGRGQRAGLHRDEGPCRTGTPPAVTETARSQGKEGSRGVGVSPGTAALGVFTFLTQPRGAFFSDARRHRCPGDPSPLVSVPRWLCIREAAFWKVLGRHVTQAAMGFGRRAETPRQPEGHWAPPGHPREALHRLPPVLSRPSPLPEAPPSARAAFKQQALISHISGGWAPEVRAREGSGSWTAVCSLHPRLGEDRGALGPMMQGRKHHPGFHSRARITSQHHHLGLGLQGVNVWVGGHKPSVHSSPSAWAHLVG